MEKINVRKGLPNQVSTVFEISPEGRGALTDTEKYILDFAGDNPFDPQGQTDYETLSNEERYSIYFRNVLQKLPEMLKDDFVKRYEPSFNDNQDIISMKKGRQEEIQHSFNEMLESEFQVQIDKYRDLQSVIAFNDEFARRVGEPIDQIDYDNYPAKEDFEAL